KKLFNKTASDKHYVFMGRMAVLIVSIVAFYLSWEKNATILKLVSFAWAGFGAAFGPTILLALYWRKLTSWGALSGMVVGAVVVFIWGSNAALHNMLYEIVPGFVLAF